jgi:hypothetical protein
VDRVSAAYSELLKDPRWQRRRLEVFGNANFACQRCGSAARTLHAHHKKYLKGRKPWDYENELLECLCDDCHAVAHVEQEALELTIARQPTEMLPVIRQAVEQQIERYPEPVMHPRLAKFFQKLGRGLAGDSALMIDAQNELADVVDEVVDFQRGSCL